MILYFSMSGGLMVPEGTVLSKNEQEIILPCGTIIKLWEAVESLDDGEDLNEDQRNKLGVYTNNLDREMELIP